MTLGCVCGHAAQPSDRDRIAVGRRADLLLVRGDPTMDILATRAIERVWKGGVEVIVAAAQPQDTGSKVQP